MIFALNQIRHRVRFALWVAWLRVQLRRHGCRLVVEAPHVVRFDTRPSVKIHDAGEGGGVTTLRFGRDVHLGRDLALELHARGDNLLELADGVFFLTGVRLQLRGGTIRFARHCHVRDGAVLKSEGLIDVGEDTPISFWCVLHCEELIEIGDFSGLAERVTIADSDHSHDGTDAPFIRQPVRVEPVRLGRNVFVSANATILRGARIGDNTIIAANSLIPSSTTFEGGHVLAGSPARPVRKLQTAPSASDPRSLAGGRGRAPTG